MAVAIAAGKPRRSRAIAAGHQRRGGLRVRLAPRPEFGFAAGGLRGPPVK